MKKQLVPKNPCIFLFSKENWVTFNIYQTDLERGLPIEIKNPFLFRFLSIIFFFLIQVVPITLCFMFNLYDLDSWWLIGKAIRVLLVATTVLYISKGGRLFHWVYNPTPCKQEGQSEQLDISERENKSIIRKDQ